MPVITLTKQNSIAKDTHVVNAYPTTNYATSTGYTVGRNSINELYRVLLQFDFGLIPNNAIINSATLKLTYLNGKSGVNLKIYPITQAWVDTTATWNLQPTYDQDVFASVVSNTGVNNFDVKNVVQSMVNGNPLGFMIQAADEALLDNSLAYCSLENATTANQPTLTIDYTIPSSGKKQVEYVGTGAISYANNANVTPALPAGLQAGDLLVLQIGTTGFPTIPNGWTVQQSGAAGNTFYLATKYAASGETAPVIVNSSGGVAARISAFRNVKSINKSAKTLFTSTSASFYPPATSVTADDMLFAIFNMTGAATVTFTPPLSYSEISEASNMYTFEAIMKYMHTNRSQSTSEMAATVSTANTGMSALLVLEPNANNSPTLTLTSPTDNQTLSEGNSYPVEGSVTDADSGNVVTTKYQINNGPVRALQSGVSDGSAPISFARTLTYRNKRIWDGSTDINGADLAENTDHFLKVWAEDDQGGKSAEVTRAFRVIHNRPPVIDGQNENLGTIMTPPSKTYKVTEPESDTFTVTEKINGTVIRSFEGVAGQQETVTIPHDKWIRLDLDTPHTLTVEAVDSRGLKSTRTYTFIRTETHIEFLLNFENPAVATHFTPDGMPERVLVTLERYLPPGSSIESVKVCNNALDNEPTWEDATNAVRSGRGYLFTNTTKTAQDWRIDIWVVIAKGTATERVHINGYGGAYD